MTVIQEREWTWLTPLVNEIKPPQSFIHNLLFSNHEVLPTDLVEIGTITGDRSMAPFVTKDSEAIMIEGLSQDAIALRPPNIRIKKPFTPSPLFFDRDYGEVIHLQGGDNQTSMIQQHIARDSQRMVDLVDNSQEYLASQALTGVIAYTNEQDGTAFQITFAKSAENTVTLSGADRWDQSTGSPKIDVLAAKRRQADAVNLQPTDVLMGQEAAEAFITNDEIAVDLDTRELRIGGIDMTQQFSSQGVVFLGTYSGLRWWEYSRQINVPGTGLVSLIRSKFCEFVTADPSAEMVEYFGAIRDMRALQGRSIASERFSKSWDEEDPSVMVQLIESHPLPAMRRPDAVYSLQVVA